MPLHPTFDDIGLRLLLTLIAGAVIGFDRGYGGHAAGLRTTILVGLAAAVAMIQANILLSVAGKAQDSFGVMDLLRFPLGILTGVGFIGGGAILRRGDLVSGVTTAATLWFMTVVGLCFGGGQLALGAAATLLGVMTLWALRWFDMRIPRKQRATLVVESEPDLAETSRLIELIAPPGYNARLERWNMTANAARPELGYEIHWRRADIGDPPWDLLRTVESHYRVISFELSSEDRH